MNTQSLPVEGCFCQDCDEARLAIENAYWEQFRPSYHKERKDYDVRRHCNVRRSSGVLSEV